MTPSGHTSGAVPRRERIEPRFDPPPGAGFRRSPANAAHAATDMRGQRSRLKQLARRYDVRAISPRQMLSLSQELYVAGLLTKDQYDELSFQPELLPSYDRTIGALIGEKAEPNRPRDYTEIWRQRLAFEARHYADEPRVIARTRKILDLLKSL